MWQWGMLSRLDCAAPQSGWCWSTRVSFRAHAGSRHMVSELHFINTVTLFTKCFVRYKVTEQRQNSRYTARLCKTNRPTRERGRASVQALWYGYLLTSDLERTEVYLIAVSATVMVLFPPLFYYLLCKIQLYA